MEFTVLKENNSEKYYNYRNSNNITPFFNPRPNFKLMVNMHHTWLGNDLSKSSDKQRISGFRIFKKVYAYATLWRFKLSYVFK